MEGNEGKGGEVNKGREEEKKGGIGKGERTLCLREALGVASPKGS